MLSGLSSTIDGCLSKLSGSPLCWMMCDSLVGCEVLTWKKNPACISARVIISYHLYVYKIHVHVHACNFQIPHPLSLSLSIYIYIYIERERGGGEYWDINLYILIMCGWLVSWLIETVIHIVCVCVYLSVLSCLSVCLSVWIKCHYVYTDTWNIPRVVLLSFVLWSGYAILEY